MLNELYKEVNKLLVSYKIAGLGIFRDWVVTSAGVDFEEAKHCSFHDPFNSKEHEVVFYIKRLNASDRQKIRTFCEVQQETKDGEITLSREQVFSKLLPAFEKSLAALANEPEKLRAYQRQSQDVVTSEKQQTLTEQIIEMLDKIDPLRNEITQSKEYKALSLSLTRLKSCIQTPATYCENNGEGLRTVIKDIDTWFESSANLYLSSSWYNLKQNVANFMDYNCMESRNNTRRFMKELKTYLKTYSINISGRKCQKLLLEMMGITQPLEDARFMPHFSKESDIFIDLTFAKENDDAINKFLHFFQTNGDNYGFIHHKRYHTDKGTKLGYCNNISATVGRGSLMPCRAPEKDYPVTYGLRLDGSICLEKILPQFKKYVDSLGLKKVGEVAQQKAPQDKFFKPGTATTTNSAINLSM